MKPAVIDRLAHRRGLALVAAVVQLAGLAGCFVDVDLGGARLSCADGRCPSGFECVAERCVAEGDGGVGDGDDAGPQVDAGSEPDAAQPAPDAAPDAAPPDAPPPSACDLQYGRAPGYQLCEETPETCQFFIDSEVAASCTDHCLAIGGGACVTGHNADPGDPEVQCTLIKEYGCEVATNNSQVCTCSLGRGP